MKTRAILAVVVLLVLAGCGGDADVEPADADDSTAAVVDQESESAEPSPTETTDPDLPDEETLEAYFMGVAENSLDSLSSAIDAAQPGSPAAAYATYLQALEQASVDGGQSAAQPNPEVEQIDGGYESCDGNGADELCFAYTDITGSDGKLTNFAINDSPIKNRLALGNGKALPVQGPGGEGTFLAAFETTASNNLLVLLSLKSPADDGLVIAEATYRSSEGRQSQSEQIIGPNDLGADSLANYALVFPNAEIGGDVTVTVFDPSFMTEGSVTFRTR